MQTSSSENEFVADLQAVKLRFHTTHSIESHIWTLHVQVTAFSAEQSANKLSQQLNAAQDTGLGLTWTFTAKSRQSVLELAVLRGWTDWHSIVRHLLGIDNSLFEGKPLECTLTKASNVGNATHQIGSYYFRRADVAAASDTSNTLGASTAPSSAPSDNSNPQTTVDIGSQNSLPTPTSSDFVPSTSNSTSSTFPSNTSVLERLQIPSPFTTDLQVDLLDMDMFNYLFSSDTGSILQDLSNVLGSSESDGNSLQVTDIYNESSHLAASAPSVSTVTSNDVEIEGTGPVSTSSLEASLSAVRMLSSSRAADSTQPSRSETDRGRPYPCLDPNCGRTFVREYTRNVHMLTHVPKLDKPFACTIEGCQDRFSRKHDRLRHEISKHNKGSDWHCSICDKWFSSASTFKRHELDKHQ